MLIQKTLIERILGGAVLPTEIIVRHCAPTLAGLKVGNLFSYRYTDEADVLDTLEIRNRELNKKGVFFRLIKMCNGMALVYVYRKKKLEQILSDTDIQEFLKLHGYKDFDINSCLKVLAKRLLKEDFPHDIGVFLGYPLDDIKAFIINKGANCKCIGCWKAYTNLSEAEKTFNRFKKCTKIYCEKYMEGSDLSRLTVAG